MKELKYTTIIMPSKMKQNKYLMAIEAIEACGNISKREFKITFKPGRKHYSKPRWHVNFLGFNNTAPDFINVIHSAISTAQKLLNI